MDCVFGSGVGVVLGFGMMMQLLLCTIREVGLFSACATGMFRAAILIAAALAEPVSHPAVKPCVALYFARWFTAALTLLGWGWYL